MPIRTKSASLKLIGILLLLVVSGYGYNWLCKPGHQQDILTETYLVEPHQSGYQAHIDPDTGQFSAPTEAQKKALKQAEDKRRDKKPAAVRVYRKQLPDGTKILDLEEQYTSPAQ